MSGVLIIGAGLAGRALRRDAARLRLRWAARRSPGRRRTRPTSGPPCRRQLLSGERDVTSLALRDDVAWPSADIALRLGSPVVRVDMERRRAFTSCGDILSYDILVIATGARPRLHPVLSSQPGVHHLRTLEDAAHLRAQLAAGGRLAVVGAGLIGAEVASTARHMGCEPDDDRSGERRRSPGHSAPRSERCSPSAGAEPVSAS